MFGSSLPWPGSASARPRGEAIPAQFVKPLVKSNKNDFLDAEAIAEAVDRQNMRFVSIKTDGQLDLQRGMVFPQDSLQAEAGDAEDPRERGCEPDASYAGPHQSAMERVVGSESSSSTR